MKNWIAVLSFALFFVPAFGQTRLELKGDYLGESLSEFKQRHAGIKCNRFSDVITECKDPDASFAGHQPYMHDEKSAQPDGLGTEFFKGRLFWISYTVSWNKLDSEGDVMELLTQKYGKPSSHYKSDCIETAEWSVKDQKLTAHTYTETCRGRREIEVTLEDTTHPEKKDI